MDENQSKDFEFLSWIVLDVCNGFNELNGLVFEIRKAEQRESDDVPLILLGK